MRCGTSFFNSTVYRSCLRRYWPVWAGLSLILLLMLPLPVLNMRHFLDIESIIQVLGGYGAAALVFGFSAITAMTVFSWMYNARSAGFTAALPLRREGMFLSTALAGCTMLALPGVLTALLTFLAALGPCGAEEAAVLCGGWLLRWLLLCLCFFGFASLCAHLTGAIWVLPAVYVLLNVAVAVFWFLISNVLALLLPGYAGDVPRLAFILSPAVRVFMFEWTSSAFPDWAGLIAYACFGVVCALLALLLARKRRMESATDTVAVPWLKPVFRWVFALGFGLCFANLLYLILHSEEPYHYLPMALFLLLGSLLGWLIAEMLVRKSYKVGSSLKTFPILGVLLIVLVVSCAFGGFGYASRVPAPEQVESASISCYTYTCVTDDPAEVAAIGELHREMAASEPIPRDLPVFVSYVLKNGNTVEREFTLENLSGEGKLRLRQLLERQLVSGVERLLQETGRVVYVGATLYEDGEYKASFEFMEEKCRELLRQGLLRDQAEGTLSLVSGWPFENDVLSGDDWIYLEIDSWSTDRDGGDDDPLDRGYLHFRVTPEAKNTWALLQQYRKESDAEIRK